MSNNREIKETMDQLVAVREEVENLIDYLEVLKARATDQGKPQATHAEVMNRYRENQKRS
jgi:Asp-tRNA(Asn)/Glu-tRNA(Gln) amidotransferase C subunit